MRKTYVYTNRTQSVYGIMSLVFGILSSVTFFFCFYESYLLQGEGVQRYAVCALLAIVFMIVGFVLGIISLLENNKFLLFRVLGIAMNVIAFFFLSAILYAGAML